MLQWILPPLVGALVGWGTNLLALKMLFHPRRALRFGPWVLQGVVPRRKADIAARLGEMVENELVNHGDLQTVFADPTLLDGFRAVVRERASRFADERLPQLHPMVGMFLTMGLKEKVAGLLADELEAMLPSLVDSAARGLEERLSFRELVRGKVEDFSVERVEDLLLSVLRREFGFIEKSGAVLGFLVGCAQSLLVLLVS